MKKSLLFFFSLTLTFSAICQLVTPVAVNDGASGCPGSSVSINVLANDTHGANNTLSVSEYTNPNFGSVILNASDNTFVYTPPIGFTGTATFTYTIKASNGVVPFSGNNHYYEFVPITGISWLDAKTAASARTYNGMQGYLVTVTSQAEQDFVYTKLKKTNGSPATGWMGASDAASEGTWRWVTGPEGSENSGQGRIFSNQFVSSNCNSFNTGQGVNGNYVNWQPGEPNNCDGGEGEDFAHFYTSGKWNDYSNARGSDIDGYIVEYGGLEPPPVFSATATVTITVSDQIPPTISCPTNKVLASCETVIPNYTTSATVTDNCTASGSIVVTQSPAAGTVIAPGATVTITLVARDASNNTSSCNFTVNRPNITPVANNDAATVCAGSSVNINVLGNDSHPQSLALTVSDNTVPSVGTLVKNANNTFTYTAPANYSGPVTFTYTTKANDGTQAFAGNNHYYEFVSSPGITWTAARAAASAKTFNGLQGYLVTITSAAENTFMFQKVGTTAWIGGSDMAQEGVWKWMDGPEAGQKFSDQLKFGPGNCTATTPPQLSGSYHNWAAGEPNDCGGTSPGSHAEDYAHFRSDGLWNDFPNNASVSGYAVEYGGLENCLPVLTATATVTITVNALPVATIAAVGGTTACPGNAVTLNANTGSGYSYQWKLNGNNISNATSSSYGAASTGSYTVVITSNSCVSLASNAIIVTISDVTPPTITCPANQVLNLDANCNAALPDYRSLITASDNCTSSNALLITQSPAAGTMVSTKGAQIITFTVTDASNNSSTCTITIDKQDITAPVITCTAPISVNSSFNTCGAVVTYINPTATDNCSGAAFNFWNSGEPNDANVAHEDYLQLYNSGTWNDLPNSVLNKSIVEFNSIITATFANYTLIGSFGGHTYYISNGTATWTSSRTSALGIGGDLASINTLAESQYLAPNGGSTWVGGYQDHSDPSYVEPGNASQNYGGWKWVDGTKLGSGQISITQIAGLPSGATFPVGVTTNVFKATDESGNASTCSFTVTVKDVQPPTITCSANRTATATSAAGAVVTYVAPVGVDNCSGATTVRTAGLASGSTFPIGTTTVTYVVTDGAGLTATCSFTITVSGLPPVINCPANITVINTPGQCGANVSFIATETTGIPASTITYSHASGSFFPVGTTTVTATATNAVGSSSCTFTVKITDSEKPTIVSAPDQTQTADAGVCKANVTVAGPVTGDNCGVQSVTNSFNGTSDASGVYPVGTTTVTWTVTDIHGNTNTSTQTISVTDNEKPTIVSAPDQTQTADAGVCKANVTVAGPATGDNCGVQSVTNSFNGTSDASGVYPVGTTTVTWTITDIHGNTNTSTQTISVTDNEKPTIVSAPDQTQTADAGVCKANVTVAGPVTGDNCGVQSVSNSFNGTSDASGVYPVGTTTVTWTVTDIHGNTNTSTQTISVTDNEKPTIVSAPDQTQTADAGVCKANVTVAGPATGDNCGVQSVTNSFTGTSDASGVYPVGTTTVTWTVTDIHGNTNTSTQTISVTDNEKPTIVSAPDQMQTADAGVCKANVTVAGPVTGDNCGVQSVTNSFTGTSDASGVYPVGTTTVTWSVTDIHGNSSTATQIIVVTDNEKPVITAPAAITVGNDQGLCSATVSIGNAETNDNCAVASVTNDHPSTIYPVGTTTVTWTVTDIHGNTQTATQVVKVNDSEAPKANCKPVTVTLVNGAASITVASVNNSSTDNCGIASITISKSTFNCSNLGTNNVVLTITDIHGNVSTCTAVVTVVGEIPTCSIASIPANTTFTGGVSTSLYLGYGAQSTTLKVTTPVSGAPYTYVWSGPVALLSSSTSSSPVFTPITGGYYTFTVVSTNKYGCTTSCTITICVTDIRVAGSDGKKVYVCHAPPGNQANWNTLSISVNAVPSHLGNHTGDRLGSCEQTPCTSYTTNAVTQTVNQSATKETQANITSEEDFTVKVAPNPSMSYFTLKFESKYATPLNLRVIDGSGKVIDARSKLGSNSSIKIGHNYISGIYYAEIIQGTKRKVVKLIKAK
jgi:hypothetical protein